MKVLVVQAKGTGGFSEPQTSAYISSIEPSAAPDNSWVRDLIDKEKVELLADLGERSDWESFIAQVNKTPNFVYSTALTAYRENLDKPAAKSEETKSEKLKDENTKPAEEPVVEPVVVPVVEPAPVEPVKADEPKKK